MRYEDRHVLGQLRFVGRCFLSLSLGLLVLPACSFKHLRPCTQGSVQKARPPLEDGESPPAIGIKKCYQVPDAKGVYVNHGKYYEWYEDGERIALEGEYRKGKKHGRWTEYDLKGNPISVRTFENGKEIEEPN